MRHRDDIDGLRSLAVLPIVLFHLGVPGFHGGYVGVDIFFVISGFLITQRLAVDWDLWNFYERRARRILPALLLVLAVSSVVSVAILMPRDLSAYGRSLAATLLFVSNIQFWMDVGYFNELAITKPLLHTWSLAVEEQFYLLFPAFLLLARRRFKGLFWPVAVLALVSLAASVLGVLNHPSAAFYWLPFRAWELLLGSCLALSKPPQPQGWQAPLGFALLAVAVFGFDEATPFPGIAALAPCVGTALLLHSGQTQSVLRLRVLVNIGKISYSMYLWHWPLVVFYRYLWGAPGPVSVVFLFALTTLLAWLSFKFVEQPVLKGQGLGIVPPLLASVAVVFVSALLMLSGLPGRFSPQVAQLDSVAGDRPDLRCHNRSAEQVLSRDLCVIGDPTQKPTWLFWGDSHGYAMQDVYDLALKQAGLSAVVATHDGCVPLVGVERPGYPKCKPFSEAVSKLAQRENLKVILISYWSGYPRLIDGEPGTSEEVIARGLRRAQFTLLNDPLPGAPVSPPRALAQRVAYGLPENFTYTRKEFLARNQVFFQSVGDRPRVSLWKELCSTGTCSVERNGPLYFDNNHPASSTFGFAVPIISQALQLTPAP